MTTDIRIWGENPCFHQVCYEPELLFFWPPVSSTACFQSVFCLTRADNVGNITFRTFFFPFVSCMNFFRLKLQFWILVSNAEWELLLLLLVLLLIFFKAIVQQEGTENVNFMLKLHVVTTFYYGCHSSFNRITNSFKIRVEVKCNYF